MGRSAFGFARDGAIVVGAEPCDGQFGPSFPQQEIGEGVFQFDDFSDAKRAQVQPVERLGKLAGQSNLHWVSWAPSRQTRLQLNRRIFSGFSRPASGVCVIRSG